VSLLYGVASRIRDYIVQFIFNVKSVGMARMLAQQHENAEINIFTVAFIRQQGQAPQGRDYRPLSESADSTCLFKM
jgi:hypothetical protein